MGSLRFHTLALDIDNEDGGELLDPDFQKDATDERDEGAVANALGDEDVAAAAVNQVSRGISPPFPPEAPLGSTSIYSAMTLDYTEICSFFIPAIEKQANNGPAPIPTFQSGSTSGPGMHNNNNVTGNYGQGQGQGQQNQFGGYQQQQQQQQHQPQQGGYQHSGDRARGGDSCDEG